MFRNGHRPSTYGPEDYSNEIGSLIQAMQADPSIRNKNMLICPSVSNSAWTPERIWDTGFLNDYGAHLAALAVEQ
jgi:hypothetical protein